MKPLKEANTRITVQEIATALVVSISIESGESKGDRAADEAQHI